MSEQQEQEGPVLLVSDDDDVPGAAAQLPVVGLRSSNPHIPHLSEQQEQEGRQTFLVPDDDVGAAAQLLVVRADSSRSLLERATRSATLADNQSGRLETILMQYVYVGPNDEVKCVFCGHSARADRTRNLDLEHYPHCPVAETRRLQQMSEQRLADADDEQMRALKELGVTMRGRTGDGTRPPTAEDVTSVKEVLNIY